MAGQAEVRCTATAAVPATIDTIQKDFKDWSGRCVRLRGLAYANHLFTDRMATLALIGRFEAAGDESIAIYPEESASLPAKPAVIEVVGKLGSCAARRIAARAEEKQQPNIIIMLTGFCHFSDENFIDPISIAIAAETKVTRLTEKEVPPDRRRLIDAPANLPDRAAKVAAARSAVAALLARDETAFLKLHDPDMVSETAALKGNAPYPQLREHFEEERADFRKQAGAHGPFAGIRLGGAQERVFVDRREFDAAKTDDQASVPVIVCWCKTPDCKDKWPVAPADAGDNEPDRPYACAWTNDYENNYGHGRSVDTSSKGKGLAEPDWSKYPAAN